MGPAPRGHRRHRLLVHCSTSGGRQATSSSFGDGRNPGFIGESGDPLASPPFIWCASNPAHYGSDDVVALLNAAKWEGIQVLAQASRTKWRFRCSRRPSTALAYTYPVPESDLYIHAVPVARRLPQRQVGAALSRSRFPWLPPEAEPVVEPGDAAIAAITLGHKDDDMASVTEVPPAAVDADGDVAITAELSAASTVGETS